MQRSTETAREKHNRRIKKFEHLSKILQMSKAMQTRFKLIPKAALNKVTVAGIRDMSLGRVKDGKAVGANVVRFNNPSTGTGSDFHRVCIDPKGVSNIGNPHIKVPPGAVKAAQAIQKGLKVTGTVLFVVSIVASGVRIAKAIYDEVDIDSEIEALENIISCLEEDLRNCSAGERAEREEALEFAKSLLVDARDCKQNPGKKTLLTGLCIGAEWGGAAALGFAGAEAGAAIGVVGGPVGSIVGAVTGGVIGAVVGSELGTSAVENFHCDKDGIGTEMQGSLKSFGDTKHGDVLGVDGNIFVGKGVEVGTRTALFQMEGKSGSLAIGKGGANFGITNKGVEVGTRSALFQMEEKDDSSLAIGKGGANFGITNKGVDVGVEAKVGWAEFETENSTIGVGLNVDTGVQIGENGVGASVLGTGFSVGDDHVTIKLPFFSYTWKK